MDHSIVFKGRLRDGSPLEEVRANFCRLFRLEPGPRLDALFSGHPVTLKKGLSEDEARRYADTLLRAGAHCEVVRPRPPAPVPVAAPTRPPVPDTTAAAPAASTSTASATPAGPALAPALGGLAGLALVPIEPRADADPEPVLATATGTGTAPGPRNGANAMPSPTAASAASPYAVGTAARRREPLLESNSSGSGANAYVPDEARGLSWGGFLMNWIWGLGNGTYIALLALLPIAGFVMPFYLLFKGRELAWRNRRWDSVEHFNRVQRRWGQVGLVLVVLVVWWSISITTDARDRMRHAAAEQTASGPVTLDADHERELARIEDPAVREQMRRFYEELERARTAQSR